MTYSPTTWVDDIPVGTGTQLNADNLNKIEQALVNLDAQVAAFGSISSGLAVVPVGAVIDWPYGSAGIPSWALLPYGQPRLRSDYTALHSLAQAAGYPHGAGDGATTFLLPDLRGRVSVGKDDMGGAVSSPPRITAALSGAAGTVLGAPIGGEGVQLTTAQLAAHNHSIDPHKHTLSGNPALTGGLAISNTLSVSHNLGTNDATHRHSLPGPQVDPYSNAPGWLNGKYWGTAGSPVMGWNDRDVSYQYAGPGFSAMQITGSVSLSGAVGLTGSYGVNRGDMDMSSPALATNPPVGSNAAHANVQPSIIVNKFIRAL